MRVLILGAGLQGSAAAYDLLRDPGARVELVDRDPAALAGAERWLRERMGAGEALRARALDLSEAGALPPLLAGADACLSALPFFLNLPVAERCADAGLCYVDLGGNTEIVRRILALDARARATGAILVPDCGLAPGLASTVAMAAIDGLDRVDHLRLRVGGLPRHPLPPLDYRLLFSIHGLVNEYLGEAVILREGEIASVPTLTGVETLELPAPAGRCEAFHTHGGAGMLPWTLRGRVRELDYKTVRYPGHAAKLELLRALGFFDDEPIALEGRALRPRDATEGILARSLSRGDEADLVVFRVDAEGRRGGAPVRRRFQLIDHFDEAAGLSAMRRCTAFPAAQVLRMLVAGESRGPGAHSLETAIAPQPCLAALRARGLAIAEVPWED